MKKATLLLLTILLTLAPAATAQQPDARDRERAVRELAKQREFGITGLRAYINDSNLDVRLEVVKALVDIGGLQTVEPLVEMARDIDPEIQARAADGLVNVYVPGYIRSGIGGSLRRAGTTLRGKFDDKIDDLVVDPFVQVPPEVIQALGRMASGGTSIASRANAARGLGILRGKAAVGDLIEALYSKDNDIMNQALIALQKIRDPEAGKQAMFVVRDLEPNIQMQALRLVGILRTAEAAPDVRGVLQSAPNDKVEREALTSLAMIAEPSDHDLFLGFLTHRNDDLRAAAAEGLARIADPNDLLRLTEAYNNERDTNPRLSMAFALVSIGQVQVSEFSALQDLINTLNRGSYRNVALAFLTEAARQPAVREALYPVLTGASRDEKTGLAIALSRSGDRETIPYLERLSRDSDTRVAEEGIRSLRSLQALLGQ